MQFLNYLLEHWDKFATLVTLALVVFAYRKARNLWKSRSFINRINFSLNYIEDKTLRIRTLLEEDLAYILLNNRHGQALVLNAAKKTTLSRPFLQLDDDDAWFVLNAILNELSQQFAIGHLAKSLDVPVKTGQFTFGITCERDPDVRTNKLRAMIIENGLLEQIETCEDLKFEAPQHHVRLDTLKRMKQIRDDESLKHLVMTVELSIPLSTP